MIDQLIYMNGHGVFVWAAFIFTLISFALLYLLINFELIKEQKKFKLKFGDLSKEKVILAKQHKINKEILDNIPNYNY